MPKVSTKSLRSLASKCHPSILTGAITESADYIDELELQIEKQQALIESQARVLDGLIDDTAKLVARNLVAWDTSKDKREGLLPEVYLKNKQVYHELTREEYVQHRAMKKFHIG